MSAHVQYGDDGPVFETRCPNCGRFLRAPESVSYGQTWFGGVDNMDARGECSRYGMVQMERVGWAGDFEEESGE